jgi:tRNA threonylcarbamoyladenosine modification (KEOPS) complex  Pcc1 subunit
MPPIFTSINSEVAEKPLSQLKGEIEMSNDRISTTLSAADMETIMSSINSIQKALPFLIDLTNDERRGLPKLGDKSRAFVTKALDLRSRD